MRTSDEYRLIGRQVLAGNWGAAVGTTLAATVLGGSLSMVAPFASNGSGHHTNGGSTAFPWAAASRLLLAAAGAILTVSLFYFLVRMVIGGAVTLGLARFNLNLYRRTDPAFSDLFSYFSFFGNAFLMNLLCTLYIYLWGLLLVVPGIMAAFSYAMTPFLLADNPGMDANSAIGASRQMMQGHRWELFCLEFSFIGWYLLCLLSGGIGFLFLKPYVNAARTAFYQDLLAMQPQQAGGPMQ